MPSQAYQMRSLRAIKNKLVSVKPQTTELNTAKVSQLK